MSEDRHQLSSEEMIRLAKKSQETAPSPAPEAPPEREVSEEEPVPASATMRNLPSPPPPPAQRSPTRKTPKFPPPPPRSDDRIASSQSADVETTRKSFNWVKTLSIAVVIGVFFVVIGNRESEPEDPALFREEFHAELADGWTWENEVPGRWTITGGALHLDPPPIAETGLSSPMNLLLRVPGVDNYTIITRIEFEPSANFQAAGLAIYQDGANSIQLVQAFCSQSFDTCVDRGVYFDNITDGGIPGNQGGRALARAPDQLFLRIDAAGNTYTSWYSIDGETWTTAGRISRQLASPRVGIVARRNAPQPPISSFEFFIILP